MGSRFALFFVVLLGAGILAWMWLQSSGAAEAGDVGANEARERAARSAVPLRAPAPEGAGRVTLGEAPPTGAGDVGYLEEEELATVVVRLLGAEARQPLEGVRLFFSVEEDEPGYGSFVDSLVADGLAVRTRDGGFAWPSDMPRTDQAGELAAKLVPGVPFGLQPASDHGVESVREKVDALAPGELREIVLLARSEPDLQFFGKVVADEPGAAPIGGARILKRYDRPEAAGLLTDSRGMFSMRGRSWDLQGKWILAEGYAPAAFTASPGHSTEDDAMVLRLREAATLEGRLLGAPPGEGAVGLECPGYMLNQSTDWRSEVRSYRRVAKAGPSGSFRIEGLPPNVSLVVRLHLPEREFVSITEPIVLKPGEVRYAEWSLAGLASLRGTVVDQHEAPVASVVVVARAAEDWERERRPKLLSFTMSWPEDARRATTGEDGSFSFEDLAGGTWAVGVTTGSPLRAGEVSSTGILVDVPESGGEVSVTVPVHRGLELSGRVEGPTGEPVAGVAVSARCDDPIGFQYTRSDEEGRFRFTGLWPGRYRVQARPNGNSEGSQDMGPSEELQVEAGRNDLVLRLVVGGRLRGQIMSADGTETPTLWLSVTRRAADLYSFGGRGRSGEEFEFENLTPGVYDLFAHCPEGWAGMVQGIQVIGGGTAEVLLQVDRGGTLRLRAAPGSERVLVLVRAGTTQLNAVSLLAEESHDFTLPVRAYQLVIRHGSEEIAEKSVTVTRGEPTEVEVSSVLD